jgi:starch synthase
MNILFATNELTPYAKTGGLGDVMAALPAKLAAKGHGVSLAIPLHRALRESFPGLRRTELRLAVRVGDQTLSCAVWEGREAGVTVFALQRDEYFDRSALYGTEEGEYFDAADRFIFFSQAVVELARYIEPQIDLIHANDWHTGLVPAYVKAAGLPFRTVYTIHNLSYQGSFPGSVAARAHLPEAMFSPRGVEFYGRLNFMKGAIVLADAVTAVSPTYAREIQMEQYGCGLHAVLAENSHKLSGILNGIDMDVWNPAKDRYLEQNYDARRLAGKAACKKALLKEMKVKAKRAEDRPVFGLVSRLVGQKGIDLVLSAVEPLVEREAVLVVLGSGEPTYEEALTWWAKKHPQQVRVKIGFDEGMAHRIEAGADFFLMPSLFEPCGLNQIYSLRYGTVPVVRDTGGLTDTVEEWDGVAQSGTGFKFADYSASALVGAIDRGLAVWKDRKAWLKIRRNGMAKDFSWARSVAAYEEFYTRTLAG